MSPAAPAPSAALPCGVSSTKVPWSPLSTATAPRPRSWPDSLGKDTIAIEADVTDEGDVRRAVETPSRHFGRLDVVFNNAGISGVVAPVHELAVEDWDTIIRINLRGIFLVLQASLRAMMTAATSRLDRQHGLIDGRLGCALGRRRLCRLKKHGVVGSPGSPLSMPRPTAYE